LSNFDEKNSAAINNISLTRFLTYSAAFLEFVCDLPGR
jgi:hypothetical protein